MNPEEVQRAFDDPERIRRGMERYHREHPDELSPAEQEIAKTVNANQLVLDGLDIVLKDPDNPESGWRKK